MSFLDELTPSQEESIEHILAKLMEPDGIALKSDLPNPLNVARLQSYADWLQAEGLVDSAAMVREFVRYFMEDMVSKGREGRKEIVRALQEIIKDSEAKKSRWTGRELEGMP